MGFEFEKRETIEIFGKDYECDTGDIGIMRGIIEIYPNIKAKFASLTDYQAEIGKIQQELANLIANAKTIDDPEQVNLKAKEISAKAEECGKDVLKTLDSALEDAASFIVAIMGEEDYLKAFKGREKDAKAHLSLCDYIHEFAIGKRMEKTDQYRLPTNRAQRRKTKVNKNEPVTVSE